jgi:hypothetical protein
MALTATTISGGAFQTVSSADKIYDKILANFDGERPRQAEKADARSNPCLYVHNSGTNNRRGAGAQESADCARRGGNDDPTLAALQLRLSDTGLSRESLALSGYRVSHRRPGTACDAAGYCAGRAVM